MIKMLELREMIKLVSNSAIQDFNLKNNGVGISMKKPISAVSKQKVNESPQEIIHTALKEVASTLEVENSETTHVEATLKEDVETSLLHQIVSPVIGVFSSSSEPGAKPFVKVGDRVTSNTVIGVCKVEALKLFHEISSNVDGEIIEVFVDDGDLIEFGEPLFLVKTQ